MSDSEEVAGVFDAIDGEAAFHEPLPEPVEEPKAEGAESTPDPEPKTKTESQDEKPKEEKNPPVAEKKEETPKPEPGSPDAQPEAKTDEPSKENKTEAEVADWKKSLPPPPPEYNGPVPEVDDEGKITNMTPDQYENYLVSRAEARLAQRNYERYIENAALDAAEKILPDIKTNPSIRTLVENARVASIVNGNQIDTVQAAEMVRSALGISPEKISQAKAEGAKNAKASITVQKNASLETSSSRKPEPEDPSNDLVKRINKGDDDAFVELLGRWEEEGKI